MDFIELVISVCAVSNPAMCEDQHLQFVQSGSRDLSADLYCAMGWSPPEMEGRELYEL